MGTIAGAAKVAGYRDGDGREARFNSPMSMGLDSEGGHLFVLDNTRLIRYIRLDTLVVTTLIGGACRAVRRWIDPVAPSVIIRSIGCHTDWLMRDDVNEEEKPDQYVVSEVCVGHRAT